MTPADLPSYRDLLWPTVVAVRALGGSASIEEIVSAVVQQEGVTEEQQQVLHNDGPTSEIAYRIAWARSYLKAMGLLHNSTRGVWNLTDRGRTVTEHEIPDLHRDAVTRMREQRKTRKSAPTDTAGVADGPGDGAEDGLDDDPAVDDPTGDDADRDWRELLLAQLMDISPAAFERLSQRLLREAGFVSATVTGRTGDGGIDGLGIYRMSLVSFPVFFQCKRYRGSVSSGAVRDFRGAMAGRGDKGLLITTGSFTAEAKKEATRDGAPPVDLIDGQHLCELLKQYELGVRTTIRTVEDITLVPDFFADL